jgi:4-amino-4-deoxy-L-arabinose transferase-like glycosyltransferase
MRRLRAAASGRGRALWAWLRAHPWPVAFGIAGAAIVAQRLVALDSVPDGLYADEAAFGYNAWAVATTGVDEHGHSWPLFFQSFDDWKSPAYIYALAPLTRVLGLTPAVVRLPAALCGIAVCALLALAAYRLTRSRPVALLVLLTAAVEPWLVVQNRVGFDVSVLVLCIAGAIWALSHAAEGRNKAWFAVAGLWAAVAVYAYTTGRLVGLLLLVSIAAAFALPWRRFNGYWLSAVPVVAAYGILLAWSRAHQDALTARYNVVGILADHPSLLTALHRVANNYIQYWGAPFLATQGDTNLRHNTGYGGELLIVTLPAIIAGIVVCIRRWREPMPRFILVGLLLSPLPAALTMDGTPHALRAAVMLPFLLIASAYGWQALLPLLTRRRAVTVAALAVALVESVVFFNDMYHYWPQRAAPWFEAGLGPAIVRAHEIAGTQHRVVLSDRFEAPYIAPLFWLQIDPRQYQLHGTEAAGVRIADLASAQPGDIMVVSPYDTVPAGATLLLQETVTVDLPADQVFQPSQTTSVVASVWRR